MGRRGNFFDLLVRDDLILINNRQQNSRRRGRGNNNQRPQSSNSGGTRNQDNGNRIDNRSRGNAAQLLEKYKTLARDAQQSGDRVLTEYYLQFSDHYFRVLADTRARYEENQPRRDGAQEQGETQNYDGSDDGEEAFDGDEFDPRPQSRVQAPQAQPRYDREPQPQETRDRNDEDRDSRPRRDYGAREQGGREQGDRPRSNSNSNGNGQDRAPRDDYRQERPARDDRPREDRAREERPRADRPRDDRPREDRPREDRPRQERMPREDRSRDDRPRRDRETPVSRDDEPEALTISLDLLPPAIAVAPLVETEEPVAPKRRGRPKKVVDEVAAES